MDAKTLERGRNTVPSTADRPFVLQDAKTLERGRYTAPSTVDLPFVNVERGRHPVPSTVEQLSAPLTVLKIVESIR
jgi:hypothetical protein